jgi:hypothetical protein
VVPACHEVPMIRMVMTLFLISHLEEQHIKRVGDEVMIKWKEREIL